ncbi:hypothetical protein RIVM261_001550 [Rivularia sp. IAM M-261]|nr:hypothetical protein RIVM261_001550 [Rivularia sp. IAM M-261]
MAGKSKDFKELLKQQKTSHGRQKMMQQFKKEIESGDDKALVLMEPEGYEKISDVIIQFLQPYVVKLRSPKEYEKLLVIGILAWNASLMAPSEREKMIKDVASKGMGNADKETLQGMREIVNELIERKQKHFPDIKRYITNYKLKQTGKDFHLSIVSSLSMDDDET